MSIFTYFQKPALTDLLNRLKAEHAGSDRADRFQFETLHGVRAWHDTDHSTHSDFGTLVAYRAITMRGDLFWRVEDTDRGHVFQAVADNPRAAMDLALRAWDSARQLRDTPAPLHDLIVDLRRGKVAFRVELQDAAATPLSVFGFRALIDDTDLFGLSTMSARAVLGLMKTEPLVSHVIYAAWARAQGAPANDTPIGFEAMC